MEKKMKFKIGDYVVHRGSSIKYEIFEVVETVEWTHTLILINKNRQVENYQRFYRFATKEEIIKYKLKEIFIK
jgi:hypothetical protein